MKLKRINPEPTDEELTNVISVICQKLYGTKDDNIKKLDELEPKFVFDCQNIAIGLKSVFKMERK